MSKAPEKIWHIEWWFKSIGRRLSKVLHPESKEDMENLVEMLQDTAKSIEYEMTEYVKRPRSTVSVEGRFNDPDHVCGSCESVFKFYYNPKYQGDRIQYCPLCGVEFVDIIDLME